MLEITKTDTIKMEYFPMPIRTLAHEFLYRFTAPVKTVWTLGLIKIHPLEVDKDALTKFAIKEFKDLIPIQRNETPEFTEEWKWLREIEKAQIITCRMIHAGETE